MSDTVEEKMPGNDKRVTNKDTFSKAIRSFLHISRRSIITGTLITGFSAAGFKYVLPAASHFLNPRIGYVITCITYGLAILLWLRLALIDPGRLPRSQHPLETAVNTETDDAHDDHTGRIIYYVGSIAFDTTTCNTCHLVLPPETDHCEETDECIVAFDHYCAWVGLPIGLRNMLSFTVCLLALCIHSIWSFTLSVMGLVHADTINCIAICGACALGGFFGWMFAGIMVCWIFCDTLRDRSPRLYTLHRPRDTNSASAEKEDTRYQCPDALLEYVHDFAEAKIKWIKHPGIRRLLLGHVMPVIHDLAPVEAERLAWAWTTVLCGTVAL